MKKALLLVLQFAVFLVLFLGGSLADPFKLRWFVSHPTPTSMRYFVPGGLILMLLACLVVLGIEVARKRFAAAQVTSIAFALALVAGLLAKFGWVTHELF